MDSELLKKFIENRCTERELEELIRWFNDSDSVEKGREFFHRIWEGTTGDESFEPADYDSLLNRIHHRINIETTRQRLEKTSYDLKRDRRRRSLLRIISNAAALLLVPVIGILLYLIIEKKPFTQGIATAGTYNEVFSSVDAITKVSLPDGSTVWLNRRSSLRYPAVFEHNNRTVELKGEGYFEVVSNSSVPFYVNTGGIKVCAKGTTFNIMAYPEEDKVEISLISGNVDMIRESGNKKQEILCRMKPYDLSVYNKKEGTLTMKVVKDDRYFSWKDGKLVFSAEPMDQIAGKLSRWFNVDIELADPELHEITLTATFVNETLTQVMELLSIVTPINYTISERKKLDDGTFERRKVKITLRK